MKKLLLAALILASATSLSACVTGGGGGVLGFNDQQAGRAFDVKAVDRFVVGTTTRDEVVAALGAPALTSKMAGGKERLTYYYNKTNQTMVSTAANVGASFLPVVGIGGLLGSDHKSDTAMLYVELENGVVTNYEMTEGSENFGGGALGG